MDLFQPIPINSNVSVLTPSVNTHTPIFQQPTAPTPPAPSYIQTPAPIQFNYTAKQSIPKYTPLQLQQTPVSTATITNPITESHILPQLTKRTNEQPYYIPVDYLSTLLTIASPVLETSSIYTNFISTNEIDLGNELLTASNGVLFLNGTPIATTANFSSLGLWSAYPAITNVDISGYNVQDVNLLTSRAIITSTIFSQTAFVSTLASSRLTAPLVSTNNINLNTINGQTFSQLVSSATNVSQWAQFPAVTNVNMNGNNLNNVNSVTANGVVADSLTATTSLNVGGGDFVVDSNGNVTGNVITADFLNANIKAEATTAVVDTNLRISNNILSIGDISCYGANLPPLDNALYVAGGAQFDCGYIHGFNVGAGPALGVIGNTTRIDLTFLGIGFTTGGFILNNVLGAITNNAFGGITNFTSGNYGIRCSDVVMNAYNVKLPYNATQLWFNSEITSSNNGQGGLRLSAFDDSNLSIQGQPFGAYATFANSNATYPVSSGTAKHLLATYTLPTLGQWRIKQTCLVSTISGNPNLADLHFYYGPNSNALTDSTYWEESYFPPAIYDITNSAITFEGSLSVNSITGSNQVYYSTISTITNSFVSTFISTINNPNPPPSTIAVSTFSTLFEFSSITSTIFSTINYFGGVNLYADGTMAQNNFVGSAFFSKLDATYLGPRQL